MATFRTNYNILDEEVVTKVVTTSRSFTLEVKHMYPYIKKTANSFGWRYIQVETKNQHGMPDILLLRGSEYWMIEAKILRREKLVKPEDNLKWQPGQLAFLKRSMMKGLRYLLAVAKDNQIAYIKGNTNGKKGSYDYGDFVRLV